MTAISRKLVFGLAVLLAATPAAADTVITADEVIACSVEPVYPDYVRLVLPDSRCRMLLTSEVCEIRLSDSSRVDELAARLPLVSVVVDSGQYIYSPAIRIREMLLLRLNRAREARARNLPGYTDVVDTIALNASPDELAARCRDMDIVLRECRRSDETIAELLRDVNREQGAIRGIRPGLMTYCLYGTLGGVPCGLIGGLIGEGSDPEPMECYTWRYPVGGAAVGCVAGTVIGMALGASMRANALTKQHRSRVNDLIRRVNRAVVALP